MANTPSQNFADGDATTGVEKFAKFRHDEYLYSAQEVAERLGVSERWVRDHATRRNPRIPAVKLGPLLRFRWRDIEEFVAAQMTHSSRRFRANV